MAWHLLRYPNMQHAHIEGLDRQVDRNTKAERYTDMCKDKHLTRMGGDNADIDTKTHIKMQIIEFLELTY